MQDACRPAPSYPLAVGLSCRFRNRMFKLFSGPNLGSVTRRKAHKSQQIAYMCPCFRVDPSDLHVMVASRATGLSCFSGCQGCVDDMAGSKSPTRCNQPTNSLKKCQFSTSVPSICKEAEIHSPTGMVPLRSTYWTAVSTRFLRNLYSFRALLPSLPAFCDPCS